MVDNKIKENKTRISSMMAVYKTVYNVYNDG